MFFILLSVITGFGRNAKQETELIIQISEKNEKALSELYDLYSGLLYSVIYKVVGKQEVAEEILQEIFVMIWNKAEMFDVKKGSVYTWLITMSRNKSIDYLRSKAHKKSLQNHADSEENIFPILASDTESPLDATIIKNYRERIAEALLEIPQEQKELIFEAYFSGYSQSELAEKFNIPLGTVKTRMRQGMLKMRDYLKDLK